MKQPINLKSFALWAGVALSTALGLFMLGSGFSFPSFAPRQTLNTGEEEIVRSPSSSGDEMRNFQNAGARSASGAATEQDSNATMPPTSSDQGGEDGSSGGRSQMSEADQRFLEEMRARIAAEDAERAERARLAARSPLGESIHDFGTLVQRGREQRAAEVEAAQSAAVPFSPEAVAPEPATPTYALRKGTVIPASLLGEIRSELPGLVRAMITLDVYDSVTGHQILIPRGSQLIGRYDNQTQAGQDRLFIYWDEVQLQNGGSIDLNSAATVDAAGASGVSGRRNGNFLTTLLGATLLNLAQNAGQTQAASDASDLAAAARIATGQAGATVTEQYLNQRLSRGTRFTIPAGTVLNVMLDQDIELPSQGRF